MFCHMGTFVGFRLSRLASTSRVKAAGVVLPTRGLSRRHAAFFDRAVQVMNKTGDADDDDVDDDRACRVELSESLWSCRGTD